jgi:WD40 repeat protein
MLRRGTVHRGVIAGILVGIVLGLGATVFFLNRRTLPAEFVRSLDSPADRLTKLVISDDGKFFAAGSSTGDVFVWRAADERLTQLGKATGAAIVSLAFGPDGLLLAGDATGRLRGWPSPDFTQQEIESPKLPVTCFAYHEVDGHPQILLGLSDGRLITVASDGHKSRNSGHAGLKALAITSDGRGLISSGIDGQLIWHDIKSGQIEHKLQAHNTEVPLLVWSPNRESFASADWNGLVKIHNATERSTMMTFQQPDAVSSLVWHQDQIITGSWDGVIRIWTVAQTSAALTHTIETGSAIYGLILMPDREIAATISGSGSVDLWKLPN